MVNAVKSVFATPKPAGLLTRRREGITVTKGVDGLRLMFIVTSNSYTDRENETITTKALTDYVERSWSVEDKCITGNELKFWHKGDPVGDIVWADMEGPFLLEVAKERPNATVTLSKTVKSTVKEVWDWLDRKEYKWAASHGFKYPDSAKQAGTYKAIRKFETSILPHAAAANPYTYAGVINNMNRDEVLEDLTGVPKLASQLRKGMRNLTKQLAAQGLEHKALGETPDDDESDGGDDLDVTMKAMLHDAHDVLSKAIEKVGGKAPDGYVSTVLQDLAKTMQPMSAEEADPNEDESKEPPDNETTGEPVDNKPKGKAMDEKFAEKQVNLMTRLISSLETMTEEHKQTREAMETIAQQVKSLSPISDGMGTLETRMKALESKLGGAPRSASRAPETEVTDKELTEAAKSVLGRTEEPLFPGSSVMIRKADPTNGNR